MTCMSGQAAWPDPVRVGGWVCEGSGSRMDEGLDNRSPQHGPLEDRPPDRHHRPAEKEHECLPRHAGADSAERLSLGAVSVAACHAAGPDRSAQASDPPQTGTEAPTDSGEKERTTAPAADP